MKFYLICLTGIIIFVLQIVFGFPSISADDGKLEDIRKETRKSKENRPNKSEYHESSSGDDGFGEVFGLIACYIIITPYALPYSLWDDGFSTPLKYQPYPYSSQNSGYLTDFDTDENKNWAIDVSSEFKIYRDDVYGVGLNLNLRTSFRLEIHADYNYLYENLKGNATDRLCLGNANVLFRFAQNPYLQMHSGFGVNFSHDNIEDKQGFNFNYSLEAYPIKPLFISSSIDLGGLGGASYVRFRTTIGIVYKAFEFNGGVEIYNIGGASLQGGSLGFKMYF